MAVLNDCRSRIYYIQQGTRGPIKIGVSDWPGGRLAGLQVSNPTRLYLLGSYCSDTAYAMEEALHGALAAWRVRGEWFKASPEVLTLIAAYVDERTISDRLRKHLARLTEAERAA